MSGPGPRADAVTALERLRDAVAGAPFGLAGEGATTAAQDAAALVHQIDDYLLPRLRAADAPLLTVVGGSTGAGKSTIVNTLVGEVVSPSGVLRPTTRSPVLACHPADRRWFEGNRVLPGLARTTGGPDAPGGPGTVRLVEAPGLPQGLALLDAPDIDSVVTENRELAAQLLAAADLWVFVTTAARYADAVPWDLLEQARERSAAIAVVLDRVPPGAVVEVSGDLARMLREHELGTAPVYPVAETQLDAAGMLPPGEVAPLRYWLHGLAVDAEARADVARRTLEGALASMERRVAKLVAAQREQQRIAEELRSGALAAYDDAREEVDEGVRSGSMLRGEVLARWQEYVGTGELMRTVTARVSAFRDRLVSTVLGRPGPASQVEEAVETGVESLVGAAADGAAERAAAYWRDRTAGRALLDGHEGLTRSSADLRSRLPGEARGWQQEVLELVREQGADKRTSARIASYTVNGAGLAVMLAVFAQTGGLTGAEIAVAGGTTAAGQTVLEAIFGDQAVRTLARQARHDLLDRVDRLFDAEARRYTGLVDAAVPEHAPEHLADALAAWRAAR